MNETIERILVATDGSLDADQAYAAMMPIVRLDNPEVTVLCVLSESEAWLQHPARVAKACVALRSAGVDAHLEIREGNPAAQIIRSSKRADLLVMSTHGRSGWERFAIGSVTEAVIRGVDEPMLVIRPGVVVREWSRLIVALDGSPRGERILEDVIPLARRLHAPVELVQSAMPPISGAGVGDTLGVRIVENPLPYLEGIQSWLGTQGVEASVKALEGRAAAQILRRAEESATSLLCMTTHGRTGLAKVLLGSITDEVIRHAPCPVLLRRSTPQVVVDAPEPARTHP